MQFENTNFEAKISELFEKLASFKIGSLKQELLV